MKAHLNNTHLLVPRSRSSAKVQVKYQGHVSQKMGVSQTHLVFCKVRKDSRKRKLIIAPLEKLINGMK